MPVGLTYLACPYNHLDRRIRESRFHAVNVAAGTLMAQGRLVFSPISQCHPIAEAVGLPYEWSYWEQYDRLMLSACAELIVLRLAGWRESVGVQAEILVARELGLPVLFMDPDTLALVAED